MKRGIGILCLLLSALLVQAEIGLKAGERIAFLGDSITQFGWHDDGGYVRLVQDACVEAGLKPEIVPAGISGHKSNQMLARLDSDVLAHQPDWLVLSCGVNDVGHGVNGVNLEDYRRNIRAIVARAQAAGIRVMLLTSTMLGENPASPENGKLAAYNDFLRELAVERGTLLVDLSVDMHRELAQAEASGRQIGTLLTSDGLHMNPLGNLMMAEGVLRGFGFTLEELEALEKRWETFRVNPGYPYQLLPERPLTLAEYRKLEAEGARREGISAIQLLERLAPDEVENILATPYRCGKQSFAR